MKSKLLIQKGLGLIIISAIICAAFTDAAMALSARAGARERITVEGEGEAKIISQDLPQARKAALDAALQNAFENALLEIMPIDYSTLAEQGFFNEFLDMKKTFILKYRILAEMPAFEDFFITIEATFSAPLILKALAEKGLVGQEEETIAATSLTVHIEGVSSFSRYQRLIEAFRKEVPFVEAVTLVEVFGTSMGLSVKYKGNIDGLVKGISDLSLPEFQIDITETKDSDIHISLIPANNWMDIPASSEEDPPLAPAAE